MNTRIIRAIVRKDLRVVRRSLALMTPLLEGVLSKVTAVCGGEPLAPRDAAPASPVIALGWPDRRPRTSASPPS